MKVGRALDHLMAGEKAEALDVLLEVWRESRAPAVADVIDVISEDVTRSLPAIEGKTRQKFQEAWLDIAGAGHAIDVGRLLATFGREPCTQIPERLGRFEARGLDPRVARELWGMVERCPCTSTPNFPLWTRLFKQLQAIGDVRMREPLEAKLAAPRVTGSFYEMLYPRIQKTLGELLRDPEPLPPEEGRRPCDAWRSVPVRSSPRRRRVASAKPAPAKRGGNEEELLALVHEDPLSDEPRLVYHDWLLERGEPRGELLTLQFKRARKGLTKTEERRERALLREHGRKWLGPIEPVVGREGVTFERGFLSSCTAAFRTKQQYESLVGHPSWSTVREITRPPFELCVHPSARSLRIVRQISPATAARLAEHPAALPFEEIELTAEEATASDRTAIARAASLPGLRRVTVNLAPVERRAPPAVRPEELSWLLEADLARRLEHLGVAGFVGYTVFDQPRPDLAAWLAATARLERLTSLAFNVQLNWKLRLARPDHRSRWSLDLEAFDPSRLGTLEPALRGIAPGTFAAITSPPKAPPALATLLAPLTSAT
ncbi:MAG: TIGR02996 domain-containing protein [Labilithrix sp.]